MNEALNIAFVFIVGLILGTIFFGGLWLTVKNAAESKMQGLLFLGSFLLRTGIVLLGLYYAGGGNWQKLVFCLIGFIIARFVIIYLTKADEKKQAHLEKEVNNEIKF